MLVISPDGRRLVYAGTSTGVRRLYLQDLETRAGAEPIPGTDGAAAPFFSPDGGSLGFIAANLLQVVSLSGGEPRRLAPSPLFGGGTWTPDGDTIYYVPDVESGIWKVPAAGGTPTPVTRPLKDGFDNSHRFPEFLPGGRKLLYTSAYGRFRLVVLDVASGETETILENETAFYGRYARSGHLMFAQPGGVMAVEFDPQTLEVGVPFEVLPDAVVGGESEAEFSISRNGTLTYFEGTSAYERTLTRIERNGDRRELETDGPKPFSLRMSPAPDGSRLAVTLARGGQQDIFVYDLLRQDLRQLVTEPHNDFRPVCSRDGQQIALPAARWISTSRLRTATAWVRCSMRASNRSGPPRGLRETACWHSCN